MNQLDLVNVLLAIDHYPVTRDKLVALGQKLNVSENVQNFFEAIPPRAKLRDNGEIIDLADMVTA
ncbi:MAG TPA: hypothetical protein VK963_00835 [Candidatus Saccharimonadales bacterium]|nr:hypothetical protein [Candidatus Saccharimonadales bacterium]